MFRTAGTSVGGAGVAVRFDHNDPYDASGYAGIAFWARTEAGNGPRSVEVNAITTATSGNHPPCDPCGKHFTSVVTFTETWTRHSIPFEEMLRTEAPETAFDAGSLIGLELRTLDAGPFAWVIDDLSFIRP